MEVIFHKLMYTIKTPLLESEGFPLRKRTHHFKSGEKEEEYAAELAPQHMQRSEQGERANTGVIVGYIGLFLALFSIALYPIVFGSLSILMGLLAVNYGSKTLGYTAVGFGSFSVLFSILYPLLSSV